MYPRNMVCFRYIIVNTVHQGDNKDDDDDDDDDEDNTKYILIGFVILYFAMSVYYITIY